MAEDSRIAAPFECSDIVFRAVPYDKGMLRKDGSHRDAVFFRRERQDPNGLSVTTTILACKAQFDDPIFGVRSIHVGTLRDYGLELVRTSDAHANIRHANGDNIPTRTDNDPKARQIAADLIERSRPVPYFNVDDADERFLVERQARHAAENSN
jgi:hypothetical protein